MLRGGGGQTFFRAFVNFDLGLLKVALRMAGTFGGVSGHQRPTSSEPCPAQIWAPEYMYISQMVLEGQQGYQTVRLTFLSNLICLYIHEATMEIVDARDISAMREFSRYMALEVEDTNINILS